MYIVSADTNSRNASESGHNNEVKTSSPSKVSQVSIFFSMLDPYFWFAVGRIGFSMYLYILMLYIFNIQPDNAGADLEDKAGTSDLIDTREFLFYPKL